MIDLEALVGHLFVVGGRAVTAPPPGALVQLAPKRSPRVRERDALFVLVLPARDTHAKAVFYEEMARTVAQRYFEQEGPVSGALRTVLTSLNDDLFKHNQAHPRQPFYAELGCLVLREQQATVVRTPGMLVTLWQTGICRTLPEPPEAPDLSEDRPLGMFTDFDPPIETLKVEPGHLAALSDASLAAVPRAALHIVGLQSTIQAAINRLKTQEMVSSAVLIMQFVPPEPVPEPAAPEPAAAKAAPAEPVRQEPAAPEPAPSTASAATPAAVPAESPPPAAGPRAARSGGLLGRLRGGKQADKRPPAVRPLSEAAEGVEGKSGARLRGLVARGKAGGTALVGAAEAARPALDSLQAESRNVFVRVARRVLAAIRRFLLRLASGIGGLQRLLGRMLPEPEPGRPPMLPTPVAAGITILIPVAVALLVVAFALTSQDETAFERCLSQAQTAQQIAQGIQASGSGDARQAWYGVMEAVNLCLPRRPNDPVLLAVRDEAQRAIDQFADVTRCRMVLLRRYDSGASVRGPILRNGVDLYTLDVTRSTLYRDSLNDAGTALNRQSQVLVQRGSAVGEYVVRSLVDIAWLSEGGARGNALLALDSRGLLVTYQPTFPPATAQALIGADRWVRPVSIETWQGRLYILDPPANQIWRYQPTAGEYPAAPEEYFVGDNHPNLTHAVDMAIDQSGNVFVLRDDGAVLKFYSGEEQLFQFSNLPGGGVGALGSASGLVLDMGLISPGFYVLDARNLTIHETTVGGTFIRSYRAPDDTSFRDLSGLAVDSRAEGLYIAAREALYYMPKCGD